MGLSGEVSEEAGLELSPRGRGGAGHGRVWRTCRSHGGSERRGPGVAPAGCAGLEVGGTTVRRRVCFVCTRERPWILARGVRDPV